MAEGLARHDAGIVDKELDGEVVGAVDYEVVVLDDVEGIVGTEEVVVRDDVDVRVDGLDLGGCAFHLGTPHILRKVAYLPLEVGDVDDVEINNADGADTRCGQIERDGGTEPTRPHNEDFCRVDFLLSLDADIGKEYMAAIPLNFFF